jgi:hypothetical protein
MSLDWLANGYDDRDRAMSPGEVPGTARDFSPFNTPIGLRFDHVCGDAAAFADGVAFDPLQDTKYDEQGLPLCCGGPALPEFELELEFDATAEADVPVDVGCWPCDALAPLSITMRVTISESAGSLAGNDGTFDMVKQAFVCVWRMTGFIYLGSPLSQLVWTPSVDVACPAAGRVQIVTTSMTSVNPTRVSSDVDGSEFTFDASQMATAGRVAGSCRVVIENLA